MEPGPPQEWWCLSQEAAEPGTVPGACLHRGVQLDGHTCVFSFYRCFCCWENSDHLAFAHLETLPCAVASGPKPALLTSTWTIPPAHHLTINLGGLSHTNKLAAFLGCPVCVEIRRKWRRVRCLKKARAIKCCNCRRLAKSFPRGWNKGLVLRIDLRLLAATERDGIGKEKVLVFPEQAVFQIILVYYREASKTLSQSSTLKQQRLAYNE